MNLKNYLLPGERTGRLDKTDRRLLRVITLLYTIITLLNLGTLSFPQTVWTAGEGETVVLDFGAETEISSVWVNGNIAEGALCMIGDDGSSVSYEQTYGTMFNWRKNAVALRTRYVSVTKTSGTVALNEMAFFDADGQLLSPSVIGGGETAACLVDEQNTVPAEPGYMNGMYFDEIYHARTAYEFLHTMSVYEWTHPPLGKLFIALGVSVFGMTPFGWRVIPALFGAAMLPVMYALAKRILRRRDYALAAMALLALDTMHFTQSRIATVDVFAVFFILLMFLFMLEYLERDFLRDSLRSLWLPLGLCGLSFGLGCASKWTGLYAGVGLAVLFFAHLLQTGLGATEEGEKKLFRQRAWLTCLYCVGVFVLVPAVIYFLSYIPFFRYEASLRGGGYGLSDAVRCVLQQQESMYAYHSNLTATHTCQSAWYQWPFTARSVWFYYGSVGNKVSNISSSGSPAVCWVAAVGFLCLLTEWVFGRMKGEERHTRVCLWVLLVAVCADFLPWVGISRCTFQYHYFPTLPFVVLGALLLLRHLEESGTVSPRVKWCWLGVSAVYFVLLYPAASGLPMTMKYAYFLEHILPTGVLFQGVI